MWLEELCERWVEELEERCVEDECVELELEEMCVLKVGTPGIAAFDVGLIFS